MSERGKDDKIVSTVGCSMMPTRLADKKRMASARTCKRILFVLPNSDEFGGLERHLLQLVERLLNCDQEISIVCFGPDIFTRHFNPEWMSRVLVWPKGEPKSLFGWAKLFWGFRPEVLVFCYGWIASFPWQAPLAAMLVGIRRRFAIQHLVLPPLDPPAVGKDLRVWLRRRFGQRARRHFGWRVGGHFCTKTICVSDAVRNSLVDTLRFSPRKTITIHNGVSTSMYAPSRSIGAAVRDELGIGSEEFILICAARLSEAKGIDILIQAVARVIHRGILCKCIIVGDGPLKESLLQLVESLGISHYVSFQGFRSDVRPYLQAATAFILTSHLEGLPLAVLEAMASGLPCIVTDVGGNAEAVAHNVSGLVVAPDSIDEAENAIVYFATHAGERTEMAKKAREIARRCFDIDIQMEQLVEAILG
jgi:glycosyltransferase involved in cell wall biosynthesis